MQRTFVPNVEDTLRIGIAGPSAYPRRSITDDPFDASKEYGFGDAFSAAFLRENTLLSAARYLAGTDAARDYKRDPNHNPYRYLQQTYDKETIDRLLPFIDDGEYEGAVSEEATRAITEDILYELKLQEQMEGSFAGALAGSLVTALFDPTTYIPVIGGAAKISRIGRAGLLAANTALATGVSETALQATQRSRSLSESLMNIGSSALIGGGLGIFGGAVSRKSTLHPTHPNNPLRRENLRKNGETVTTVDGKRDDISAEEIDELQSEVVGASSVGAAAARNDPLDNTIARSNRKGIVRKVGDFFNSATIAGRVVRAQSATGRSIGLRLMDVGGVLLKSHLRGEAGPKSAEIIKANYMADVDQLYMLHATNTAKLNRELGKRMFSRGKVTHADVMQVTQRELFGMQDDALDAKLVAKYGPDAAIEIKKTAKENAQAVHAENEKWEKRLIKEGLLQDVTRVSSLRTKLDGLKKQIEDTDAKAEGFDPKALASLRAQRDEIANQLRTETAKAVPLGRDYGHAQLWKNEAILENPEEFKAFLMDALAFKPDDDWLIENYRITTSALEDLRVEDPAQYRSILAEWAGDERYFRLAKLERLADAASENYKQAKLDLQEAVRAAGEAKRDEKAATLSQARAKRDAVHARAEKSRAAKAALESELKAIREAQALARNNELDARTIRNLGSAQQTLEEQLGQLRPAAPRVVKDEAADQSIPAARRQSRTEEVIMNLQRETAKLRTLEFRAQRLDEKLRKAEDAKAEETRIRRQLEDDVALARKELKIEASTAKGVIRALRKTAKATPLEQTVNDIYNSLANGKALGSGIMDRIAAESDRVTGRVKDRTIILDRDMRMEAIRQGWLDEDLSKILFLQYRQLAAELAVREGVGIGPNRTYSSWSDALKAVDQDYEDMLREAGDRKAKDRVKREWRIMRDDLIEARDRLKGVYDDDGTTDGWLKWGSEKVRQANYLRFGGGFLVSSLTDTATVALRHGSLLKLMAQYGPKAIDDMTKIWKEAPTELQSMIASIEYGMGAAASARRFGQEDLVHGHYANYGIGTGLQRRITGAIDKGADTLSHAVANFSGLPLWNRFWKTVSGMAMSNKLNRLVLSYDKLQPNEIADLASLGIGRSEAARLAKYLKEHGVAKDGHFDPHFEKWGDTDEAVQAVRDFRIAIIRDMERAINTPGIGDTPRLMSKWHGRTWLQFQTFAFTFMNRYAYPLVQRASLFKERQAFMSLGILLSAATFVMFAKDIMAGRDPSERLKKENALQTAQEIVDRSGLLAWTSPFADSALKLTAPITGYGGTNRYARNSWLESLTGVTGALFGDLQRAGSAAASADPDIVDKLLVLSPFGSQARLLNQLIQE